MRTWRTRVVSLQVLCKELCAQCQPENRWDKSGRQERCWEARNSSSELDHQDRSWVKVPQFAPFALDGCVLYLQLHQTNTHLRMCSRIYVFWNPKTVALRKNTFDLSLLTQRRPLCFPCPLTFLSKKRRTMQPWGCVIYGSLNVKAVKSGDHLLPVWLRGRIQFRSDRLCSLSE